MAILFLHGFANLEHSDCSHSTLGQVSLNVPFMSGVCTESRRVPSEFLLFSKKVHLCILSRKRVCLRRKLRLALHTFLKTGSIFLVVLHINVPLRKLFVLSRWRSPFSALRLTLVPHLLRPKHRRLSPLIHSSRCNIPLVACIDRVV